MAEVEEQVEDLKSSSGGLAFELVLEAPKTVEPPEVLTNRSESTSPRDKTDIEMKIARAEERRKEFLDSKLESVRVSEGRRSEVLTKQKEEEEKFIEQTKKKIESDFEVVEANKEAQRKLFEETCQQREARIEQALKRAANNPVVQP
ncbi:uncharacterized protein LOC134850338 isoform X2 [Symsagittifera roscoffensis]